MTIAQRLLQYYLSSVRFSCELDDFLEDYDHDPRSEIYQRTEDRLNRESGCHVSFSDDEIQRYFTEDYVETQVFSVVFGSWWGLTETQLAQISDRRNSCWCQNYLDFFICNPEIETPPREYLPYIESLRIFGTGENIPWQKNLPGNSEVEPGSTRITK